ncbi:MAG TPA: ABC transporter substrate-binding protein, partial [Pyrinomonadaceae bacterium]|nr:ABC transporter substrate-binding protein [Pyrinomonadaceae bacterium]
AEHEYDPGRFDAPRAADSLKAAAPDHVFFFGPAEDFLAFARESERSGMKAALLSSAVMLGRAAFELPAPVAARTYLAYPGELPDGAWSAEFTAVMAKGGAPLRSPAFQAVAYAAAKTLVEAAKSSGRQLTRASLVASLERLRDFQTGVLPPLTFGPNRRVGSEGAYVVGLDLDKKQYAPLGARVTPK